MKRTTLFCLLSAATGALAATAWHQTAHQRQLIAQERGSLLRSIETPPPPLPPARRPTDSPRPPPYPNPAPPPPSPADLAPKSGPTSLSMTRPTAASSTSRPNQPSASCSFSKFP